MIGLISLCGRFCLVAAVALWAAACVMADKPAISLDARKNFKLTGVEAAFADDAMVHVSDLQDEALAKELQGPAVNAYQKDKLRPVIASQFMAVAGPRMSGAQPVTIRLKIARFFIPGALGTLVLGGNRDMIGGIDLVDARTGQLLSHVPPGKITVSKARLGGAIGLAALAVQNHPNEQKTRELVDLFALDYVDWLLSP